MNHSLLLLSVSKFKFEKCAKLFLLYLYIVLLGFEGFLLNRQFISYVPCVYVVRLS
jgi:hypothetical protein